MATIKNNSLLNKLYSPNDLIINDDNIKYSRVFENLFIGNEKYNTLSFDFYFCNINGIVIYASGNTPLPNIFLFGITSESVAQKISADEILNDSFGENSNYNPNNLSIQYALVSSTNLSSAYCINNIQYINLFHTMLIYINM